MSHQLREENIITLASVSAAFSFPYIWGGMILLLAWLYNVEFFGPGMGGTLVAALLCLGLANPIVPGFISSMAVRPMFRNLLGMEIITAPGCVVGLAGFAIVALSVLFFLGRDFELALSLFGVAPVAGSLLSAVISLFTRRGLPSLSRRRPLSRVPARGSRDHPRLPEPGGTSSIQPPTSRVPSRLTPPRRAGRDDQAQRPPRPPRRT